MNEAFDTISWADGRVMRIQSAWVHSSGIQSYIEVIQQQRVGWLGRAIAVRTNFTCVESPTPS